MGKITQWVKIIIICFLFGFTIQLYSFNSPRNNFNENYGDGICYVFSEASPINQSGFNIPNNVKFSNMAAALTINITEITAATCSNKADGSLKATASGGQAPYSYSWTGPESFTANTATINNLKPGNYTVKATDANDVFLSKSHTLSFKDLESPTITAPANVSANTDSGNCTASGVNLGTPTTSDNCGVKSVTNNAPSTFPLGVTSVIWTVIDNSDNKSTATHTVTINDIQNPTITAPANVSANTDSGKCTASGVNLGTPTTSDNCGVKSVTNNAPSTFPLGVTSVIWTVIDNSDNETTATHTVTINDIQNPTITAPANVSANTDSGKCTASGVNLGTPTTSDNCGVKSFSNNAPSIFPLGDTSVIWTVIDDSENETTAIQTVTVNDNEAPVKPVLADIDNWSCGKQITDFPVTTDNCSGEIVGTTTDPLVYDTFGIYTITWIFTDAANNSITANQQIIIPEPTVNQVEDIVVCNGESVLVNFDGSTVTGTTYKWTNSKATIGIAASGTGNISSFKAINNTSEIIVSEVIVTPVANGCEGISKSFNITINPTPTITKPADIVVCAGTTVGNITFLGASVTGTTINWTNDNIAVGLEQTTGNGTILSFTATNSTPQSIFAIITLTPSANNCEGIPETFKIEVKPRPIVTAPEDQVYCNGVLTTAISLTGSPSGILYDIKGGAAIGLSNKVGVAEIPAFTALKGTASIEITPKANGCIGKPVIYNITVNPTPSVSLTPPNQTICSGENTNISLSGQISGTTFNWVISEISPAGSITGATDGIDPNLTKIDQTLTNITNAVATIKYKITPTANNCIGTPITTTITVNPTPELQITNPPTVCSPAKVDLTAPEITNGSSTGITFAYWTNETGTIPISDPTKVGAGTFYIEATSGSGCSIIKPVVVTENPTPELTNTLNPSGICGNSVFSYAPTTNTPNTTVTWIRKSTSGLSNPQNSGSGNPDETLNLEPAITSTVTVTYFFTLTTAEGCENIQEVKVDVTPTPTLSNSTTSYTICGGSDFSFTPQSEVSNTTFLWTRAAVAGNIAASGTGAINETLINNTSQNVGVEYIYSLRSNNCSNPQEYSVIVTVLTTLDIAVSASKVETCPGESINLFSSSELKTNLPTTLLSQNFNGSNDWTTAFTARTGTYNSPTYNYNIASNDNSRYYLSDGGSQSGNRSLRSPSINTIGYTSLSLNFDLLYLDRGDTFGDTGHIEVSTNGTNWTPLIQPINRSIGRYDNATDSYRPNSYNLNLTAYIDITTLYVRFRHNAPVNSYLMAVDNVSITGEGSKDAQVTWTSNVGGYTSSDNNPVNVKPLETTIYTATYTDPDTGCPNSNSVEVIVRQPPTVTITPNYCGNSTFIELVSDNVFATYQWESAGKILGTERSVNVELAQTYTLTVTDDFGCMGIGSISVSDELLTNGDFESGSTGFYTEYGDRTGVSRSLYPEGLFAVDDNANFYHDNFYGKDHTTGNGNFMIINGHPGSGKVIWRQTIENIQPNTNYYFSAWGMNLNPSSPARLQFQVNGIPTGTVADLKDAPKPTSNGQVNTNNWVQFYSNPFWNSGDATTAVLEIINLETIRDGNDFGIDDVSFGTLEPIIFSIDPANNSAICEGSTLELYANIEGGRDPIEFKWTNANGDIISTDENPILENLLATDSGTYTLTVTDGYGCNPQIGTTQVTIIPETLVNAGEDQVVCAASPEIQLNASIQGSITSGSWTGGNGTFNPDRNTLNALYTPSTDEISASSVILTLTSDQPDAPCEPVTDTVSLTINPTPIIDIIETVMPTCYQGDNGSAKAILSGGTGAYTYAWSNGQTTQTATGLVAGEYSVTITNESGCTISKTTTIIEPTPLEIIASSFTPVQCFSGEDGTVSIDIAGGILEGELPEYIITLLDKDGTEVYREEPNSTGSLTVSNLIASTYTFTVTTSNACTSLSTVLTINQPDEIPSSAGNDVFIAECGTTLVELNAAEFDTEVASGSWSITLPSDGAGGTFGDATNRQSRFTGNANTSYTLRWTIIPANGCPPIFDELEIKFPPSCSKLDFDGVDDYVDFGDNFNLLSQNSFSLEAWIKPNSINGINTIISKRNLNDLPGGGYDLILNNGKPALRLNNITISTIQSIGTDRWYHIAAVQEGSLINLYVDGIKLKTDNLSTKPGNISAPMLIGAMFDPAEPLYPKNNFHGWIEEVRIWKIGLNQEQVRFMMNQRIKNNNGKVQGETIPIDVPKELSWSNLEGYYRLKTNEVNNGLTSSVIAAGPSGILKNIETLQQNTAPLPYESETEGNWKDRKTWDEEAGISGDKFWSWPNDTGINNEEINWNIAIQKHGIISNHKDIKVLGLISKTGAKLTMNGDNNNSGNELRISHYLKLDGEIDLDGESQLVQTEGSILDETSSGIVEKDQQGTANSFNYNYWSSPVSIQGAANNSGYNIKQVLLNGTNSSNPIPMTFVNGPYGADDAGVNITNYWLYKFRGTASIYSEWKYVGSTGKLETGEGFTMKGTSGTAAISDRQNYTFSGKPNNGNLLLNKLNIGIGQNYLLGNPYPSSINAYQFIKDNIAVNGGTNTKNIFNGALYFWDHFASGDTHNLAEYVGGYATLSLAGGVPAISNDVRINNNNAKGTKIPRQYIPVAQGFFINTTLDPEIAKTVNITVDGGDVVFKNGQRTFVKESETANSQFLSQEKPKIKGEDKSYDTRSKIRLVYESPKRFNRQILVTADENTTNDFDLGYDALLNDAISEDMYWVINEKEFVIQGVPNFNKDQELPLGVKLKEKGEFVIKIHELENIKDDVEIYLKNIVDSTYHDLRAADFITTLDGGTYNKKYVLVFHKPKDPNSGTDGETDGEPDPIVDVPEIDPIIIDDLTEIGLLHSYSANEMMVLNPKELSISAIYLFDLNGKLLHVFEGMLPEKEMFLKVGSFSEGIYILKMHTEDEIITRKIIIKK